VTADHSVQDDARTPQIGFLSVILKALDEFGCRVARRPTGGRKLLAVLIGVTKTEIDHLEVKLFIQEEVFGLDVSVDDAKLT
jgi:hypothetical protein